MKNKNKSNLLRIVCIALCAVFIISLAAFGAYAQSPDTTQESASGENFFESLYLAVREHIGDIMCAVSLALTLLMTVLYKKGLMPYMTHSLSTIGSAINSIQRSTEKYADDGGISGIKAMLEQAQETVSALKVGIAEIEKTLCGMASERSDIAKFKAVMECQSTLLFDILMSSSIPQYQKDAVGEKLAEIKAQLAECSCLEGAK